MKVTRLGPAQPILTSGLGLNAGARIPSGGNDLQVLTSNGSNGRYWGENVRRITSNGSNTLLSPDVNFASGSGITFALASNTLTVSSTSSLTVEEEDGTPSVSGVTKIQVTNGKLTNDGGGTVSLNLSTGVASSVTFVGARVKNTDVASQTITTATWTALSFGAEDHDSDAFHDNATNPSRLTVPAGKAGKYAMKTSLRWASNATGERNIAFAKNGTRVHHHQTLVVSAAVLSQTLSDDISLAEGDYVEVMVHQNSGGNLDVGGGSGTAAAQAYFALALIGT